ncbi:hypothetical protein F0P96_00255 [Hymenobacter busanensis]|uniref:Uncharacterized protein n=1 Tax=Hymenobacter busanensis TaxID=2607656 RepID=A0A7L4ZUM8_9BACT|nr:hypothetical protein [Hymenobacter busanensis]KAA9339104.1 hypothetical protein F0P96_00255 [Hymenobacter busanensis]QHJ07134.1 hypothetical protein GUY19_07495 [Hymenobacter busanensis]
MKKHSLVFRLFSLWLALLVLTSSVGLTVQQHTCHISGQTQRAVVLTPRHSCAPPKAAAPGCKPAAVAARSTAVQDGCCAFSVQQHKMDAFGSVLLAKVPVPALVAVLPKAAWAPVATAAVCGSPQAVFYATDASPPPLAGRALLAFVCTLVV